MQHQIDKTDEHGFEIRPKFTRFGDDKFIGSAHWFDASSRRNDRYVVLTIRDGQIADMQVCSSWRDAKRFAKRTS